MILPKLRASLGSTPSTDPQQPGLVMWDQYRYSDARIVVPPLLMHGLRFFDGAHTDADLALALRRHASDADTTAIAQKLFSGLDEVGFLENATFAELRASREKAFAESPVRKAVFAGGGYSANAAQLGRDLQSYISEADATVDPALIGIAAPHVNPCYGARCFGAAYGALSPDLRDRTFLILGTSHYGYANTFGLTRKPFETPFGLTGTDPELLDELAAHPAVMMEDYCEAIEHSIEFQVLFLQHLYGPSVKILPLLCGSFWPSVVKNGMPEDDADVRSFFATLREIGERDAERIFWVLGVDMAHIGMRYGDPFEVTADHDRMLTVRERDAKRIRSITDGNSGEFWEQVKQNQEDLRWCGASAFYTFMQAAPQARGALQRYEQWNIDKQSVVSFAGINFTNI